MPDIGGITVKVSPDTSGVLRVLEILADALSDSADILNKAIEALEELD